MERSFLAVALAAALAVLGGTGRAIDVDGTVNPDLKTVVDGLVTAPGTDLAITISKTPPSEVVSTPTPNDQGYYYFISKEYNSLTITGNAKNPYQVGFTPGTADDVRVFGFTGANTLTMSNFDISGGHVERASGLADGGGTGGSAIMVQNDANPFSGATFTNLKIHDNSTLITQSSANGNMAAGAVIINGTDSGGLPRGTVIFSKVELSGNTATMDNGVITDTSSNASGGGARLQNLANLRYEDGVVRNNQSILAYGDHAVGGGLDIEADGASSAAISRTTFEGNRAEITGSITGGAGNAMGGAVYFYNGNAADGSSVSVGGSTFTRNVAAAVNSTAKGGAVHFEGNVTGTVSSNAFSGNSATSTTGAALGGAVSVNNFLFTPSGDAVAVSFAGNTFSGNAAKGGEAGGGALYSASRVGMAGDTLTGNTANATSSDASGGALHLAADGNVLSNVTISGNSAYTTNSSAYAMGGGIYLAQGENTIRDSNITGNRVKAGTANGKGGGIFVDTAAAGGAVLNLTASSGSSMTISGNRANGAPSGIYIGDRAGGSGSLSDATLNIDARGLFQLLDPINVEVGANSFLMNKTGGGRFDWDGVNTFNAASANINLAGGTIVLQDGFTAKGVNNATRTMTYAVDVAADTTVNFNLSRSASLAMFDFSDIEDIDATLSVAGARTFLGTDPGRQILSIASTDYLVASGLDPAMAAEQARNLAASGDVNYVFARNGNIYANADFVSPYDLAGDNARNVSGIIQNLAKATNVNGDYLYTLDQVAAMRNNPWSVTPELYMNSGNMMITAVDTIANSAVEYGLVQMRRADSRLVPAYSGSSSECGYGNYVVGCEPEAGYRVWAGYIGDFNSLDSTSAFDGYSVDRHGFLIGVNYDFGEAASIGVYGGYSYGDISAELASSTIESDNGHFGALARVSPSETVNIYFDAGYHFSTNDMIRKLDHYNASGSYDQTLTTIGLGVEYVTCLGDYDIIPYARARFTHLYQSTLNESGLTANHVDSYNKNAFNTRLGVEASRDFDFASCVVTPSVNLAWRREYGNRSFDSAAQFIGAPVYGQYRLSSAKIDRDSLDLGAALRVGLEMGSYRYAGVNLGYNFNISRKSDTHTVYAGFEMGF